MSDGELVLVTKHKANYNYFSTYVKDSITLSQFDEYNFKFFNVDSLVSLALLIRDDDKKSVKAISKSYWNSPSITVKADIYEEIINNDAVILINTRNYEALFNFSTGSPLVFTYRREIKECPNGCLIMGQPINENSAKPIVGTLYTGSLRLLAFINNSYLVAKIPTKLGLELVNNLYEIENGIKYSFSTAYDSAMIIKKIRPNLKTERELDDKYYIYGKDTIVKKDTDKKFKNYKGKSVTTNLSFILENPIETNALTYYDFIIDVPRFKETIKYIYCYQGEVWIIVDSTTPDSIFSDILFKDLMDKLEKNLNATVAIGNEE
jgi:hypothetical protein